jgi:flagellar basal body rod protein FlgB
MINSPQTQEMIKTGGLYGYYGHQFRILFGLDVPETAIIGGKQVSISPAVRTISMSADQDGNITHRQEFLETAEGEHAMHKYKAQIGGFSAANDYEEINGIIYPTVSYGMDYVLQPNFINNIGDGMLLDGVHGSMIRESLELSALTLLDSIHSTNYANAVADEWQARALESEAKLEEIQAEKEQRMALWKAKHEKMLDSVTCETRDLQEYMQEGQMFLLDSSNVVPDIEPKKDEKVVKAASSKGGWFGGWF